MKDYDELSGKVIGCAIEVHRALGPGLLESAYERCLSYELSANNIRHLVQKEFPVKYKDIKLDCDYRIDLLIEDKLIVELKSVDVILPIHKAQILSYMKLTGIRIGLLINFNVCLLRDGVQRFVL